MWPKLLLAIGAVVAVSAAGYTFSSRPVVRELAYGPCTQQYGQTVAEWDQDDYHYVARSFEIGAEAQMPWYVRNVIEAEPKEISSNPSDPQACDKGGSDLLDLASENYRWEGARSVDIRLGAQESAGAISPRQSQSPAGQLQPPLSRRSAGRAAASLDDVLAVSIVRGNPVEEVPLLCHGLELAGTDCSSIIRRPGDKHSLRGASFIFTADNCPPTKEAYCNYLNQFFDNPDFSLYSKLTRDDYGLLEPFFLRQKAVSTYGPKVGGRVVLSFKYPRRPEIVLVQSAAQHQIKAGKSVDVPLTLLRKGPKVDFKEIILELPAGFTAPAVSLSPEQLTVLNTRDVLLVNQPLNVADGTPEACHEVRAKLRYQAGDSEFESESTQVATVCVKSPKQSYTYRVEVRGTAQSDLAEFKAQFAETLNSELSWAGVGLEFSEVQSGGNFVVLLASPDEVAAVSPVCDSAYSCQSGSYVVINDLRWRTATEPWNAGGGSLRDYRHMVSNHELGHWLAFGHARCAGPDQPAAVMQQQSIDLQGCAFNPWPLPAEKAILAARLGL